MTILFQIEARPPGAPRERFCARALHGVARTVAALMLLLLGAFTTLPAAADALDEIELLRSGDDAVVRIRFSVRVQYLRHLALGNDGVDIFFQFGVATSPALAEEQRRVIETPTFPGVTALLPLQQRAGQPSRLNVRFTRPVKFIVRQFGGNAIDIVIAGLGGQVSAARPRPGVDLPPVPSDQRYAIRLQSFRTRDMPDARPVPREFQEFTAFTSQSVVGGQTVYELLLGYFASEADAEGARRRLTARFPDAQVIDLAKRREDALKATAATTQIPVPTPSVPPPVVAAPVPPVPTPPVPPTVPPPVAALPAEPLPPVRAPEDVERQADDLMKKARAALEKKSPNDAIESLNQLLTLPPNSQSQAAQEMIGVAREQNGETSKARAEYELYLKLFPAGAGTERVRQRLAQLGTTGAPTAAAAAQRRDRPPLKTLTGSVSQYYYGGQSRIENVFNTPTNQERSSFSAVDQSQLLTTVDLNGRYRSGDTEQRIVFRDSYSLSFLSDRDSYNRLNAAYYDYRGLTGGFAARLGRQTGLSGGLPGRFDGGVVGYGSQRVRLNLAGGEPVEFNTIDSRRRFADLNLEVGGLAGHWNGNVFGIYQEVDGIVDRQAVGGEIRFVDGVRSLYVLGDYDTSYKVMNAASVQGSWTTKGGTSINLLWDRRRAPTLTTTNAIIGQPTTSISTLLETSTEDQIRQAALDITAVAVQASLGITSPVSERWQLGADVRLINVGSLPEVVFNGITIPAQPATGDVISYSVQAIGTKLYSPRDSNVWSVGYVTAPTYDSWLATYNNVTNLGDKWSLEPAIRFYQQSDITDIKIVRISPGLRLTWRPSLWSSIELDGLFEQTKTTSTNVSDTSRRYFYSLGYRLDI
jgi:hypothetical protein